MREPMGMNFEIARMREIGKDNSGLPEGAVKCTDQEINRLLQRTWTKEIRFYNDTRNCINGGLFALASYEVEESAFNHDTFNNQLTPIVEGYPWYRGFAVKVDGGKVLIFSGWMQPWREGGAPDPIVYTLGLEGGAPDPVHVLGGLPRETVLGVIRTYCSGIRAHILKERRALIIANGVY